MEEPPSTISAVNALLDGYGSLSVARLLKPLADDFHHQVLPESLQMESRNREEFARHAKGIFEIFESFRMIPSCVIEDVERGVVVVHARMQGTLKPACEEWNNECIMIIWLSDDRTKIIGIKEFVDSMKAVERRQRHAPSDFGQ